MANLDAPACGPGGEALSNGNVAFIVSAAADTRSEIASCSKRRTGIDLSECPGSSIIGTTFRVMEEEACRKMPS